MQLTLKPISKDMPPKICRLAMIRSNPGKSTGEVDPNNRAGHESTANSMKSRIRLKAADGGLAKASEQDACSLALELNKAQLILDAKRSQLRKMRQLSKLRFISRLISLQYLDEVADEIVWYEAMVEKIAHNLNPVHATAELNHNATALPTTVPMKTTA
jgi:hypothetical protein